MKNYFVGKVILALIVLGVILLAGCASEGERPASANGDPFPFFRRVDQQGPDGGVRGFRPNSGLGDFKISGGTGLPAN